MHELLYDKILDGKTLSEEIFKSGGSAIDENGKSYWWDTIDKTKNYQVKKYEYTRLLHPDSVISYRIKELQ